MTWLGELARLVVAGQLATTTERAAGTRIPTATANAQSLAAVNAQEHRQC